MVLRLSTLVFCVNFDHLHWKMCSFASDWRHQSLKDRFKPALLNHDSERGKNAVRDRFRSFRATPPFPRYLNHSQMVFWSHIFFQIIPFQNWPEIWIKNFRQSPKIAKRWWIVLITNRHILRQITFWMTLRQSNSRLWLFAPTLFVKAINCHLLISNTNSPIIFLPAFNFTLFCFPAPCHFSVIIRFRTCTLQKSLEFCTEHFVLQKPFHLAPPCFLMMIFWLFD